MWLECSALLWLQAFQVLWQGVLLDVLLDVPAREVGLQVFLYHEVQCRLARDRKKHLQHPGVPPGASASGLTARGLPSVQ